MTLLLLLAKARQLSFAVEWTLGLDRFRLLLAAICELGLRHRNLIL